MDREPGCPPAQGLYDPSHEKDACGVGFVVHVKGVRSHGIVTQALQLLVNLLHRGACGCEVNTGDGAGILIQMPDKFLRKETRNLGITLPPAGEYGAGCVFLPRESTARATIEALIEEIIQEEGQTLLGWRDLPTDDRLVGASAAAVAPYFKQMFVGANAPTKFQVPVPVPGTSNAEREPEPEPGTLMVRTEALCHPQAHRARRRRAADLERRQEVLLHPEPLRQHAHLQGHADRGSDRDDVSRSGGSGRRVGAGARAPAIQHEHVPVVAARASVPLRRAQRRDQHASRQHQLDARTRGDVRVGSARRRPEEDPAGHPRRRQRHGDLRQRARIPGDDRPLAAARRAHDDSRAMGGARVDVGRAKGLLRVPRDDDGAVGRPGVDCVHRRHGDWRRARSQRPAAVALLRHEGRPRGHGVRGRRAGHSRGEHPAERAAAPGPHLPHRYRAGAHHRRRGNQARPRLRAAVRRVAGRRTWWRSKISSPRPFCRCPTITRC